MRILIMENGTSEIHLGFHPVDQERFEIGEEKRSDGKGSGL